MKKQSVRLTMLVIAAAVSGLAFADPSQDFGKREFDANCASCHGVSGKGDGPMKASLAVTPADLTMLAKRNNGVLPVVRLQSVIDGRMEINSHGSRVMPVWGQDYAEKAGAAWQSHMDVPFTPEYFVRGRIMALVDYIARLQEK